MKHLKILVWVPFATSKVVVDIQYKKHCIRVASRVAERPQEIRKYWEYHKNGRRQSLVPSLPSANKNLALVVKNYAKTDFKVFLSCPILLNFLTLFHKFCPRLQMHVNKRHITNINYQYLLLIFLSSTLFQQVRINDGLQKFVLLDPSRIEPQYLASTGLGVQ